MPIWDFNCRKCNAVSEYLAKSDEEEIFCKYCKDVLIRVPFTSKVSFNFKGNTGWYRPGFDGYKK